MFTILVVEDEINIRKLMRNSLERKGYNVLEANDGEKALEILDLNYTDLIITDIMMPKIDGIELARDLREAGYQVPILIATAKETLDDKKIGFLSRC
jgi:Response regulator containing CheY-like receiver, AAA-type ATPase, and DNA-binding domains